MNQTNLIALCQLESFGESFGAFGKPSEWSVSASLKHQRGGFRFANKETSHPVPAATLDSLWFTEKQRASRVAPLEGLMSSLKGF